MVNHLLMLGAGPHTTHIVPAPELSQTVSPNIILFTNWLHLLILLNTAIRFLSNFDGKYRTVTEFKTKLLQERDWLWAVFAVEDYTGERGRAHTVYPKKYAHGFCFAVLCCGYTLTDFPISIRLTSLALWQSNDCPSASKATLMNMDKYFMWIHYERLHNHNKAKHNKTVCIFHGIYSTLCQKYDQPHATSWTI